MSSNRFQFSGFAVVLFSILLTGCPPSRVKPVVAPSHNPLSSKLQTDAPGFSVIAPPAADAELGRYIVNNQPATNMCFSGTRNDSLFASWSATGMHYKGDVGGAIKADFGDLFSLDTNAGQAIDATIWLSDVKLLRLDTLYFEPSGPCFDMVASNDSSVFLVLTRALRSGKIDIKVAASSKARLAVNTGKFGGKIVVEGGAGRTDSSTWVGTNIYFGALRENIQVKRVDAQLATLSADERVDLRECGFILRAIGTVWQGDLSCMGGITHNLNGGIAESKSQHTGAGVSYTVTVFRGKGVGQADVRLTRYTTSTAPTRLVSRR